VVRAVEWANANGLGTFGITGYDGGLLRQSAQAGLHVALDDMGAVESMHLLVFHFCIGHLKDRMARAS
jgi:D-sedoheptulose 7-phosphate isomerase